jgi:hypothetical protein
MPRQQLELAPGELVALGRDLKMTLQTTPTEAFGPTW